MKTLSLVALLILFSTPAMAYVGPGLGMGVIGTIFGVLAAIVLALFGLFWYPLKRALNKKKNAADSSQTTPVVTQTDQAGDLDTSPSHLETPPDTTSNNHAPSHPGAHNVKPEQATTERTESQVQ